MTNELMTELLRVGGAAGDAGVLDWIKVAIMVPGALRLLLGRWTATRDAAQVLGSGCVGTSWREGETTTGLRRRSSRSAGRPITRRSRPAPTTPPPMAAKSGRSSAASIPHVPIAAPLAA